MGNNVLWHNYRYIGCWATRKCCRTFQVDNWSVHCWYFPMDNSNLVYIYQYMYWWFHHNPHHIDLPDNIFEYLLYNTCRVHIAFASIVCCHWVVGLRRGLFQHRTLRPSCWNHPHWNKNQHWPVLDVYYLSDNNNCYSRMDNYCIIRLVIESEI